ncbi:MAG: YqcI/YcgG family protein [Gemmatimonadetes bacterium]|nr:YqcI/YcgG family protein [Gemmatimonadota bacterium]
MSLTQHDDPHAITAEFVDFVRNPTFPCLAGKGVVNSHGFDIGVYGHMGSWRSTRMLARELRSFTATLDNSGAWMRAFVAVFTARAPGTESEFEAQLWTQLQRLHDLDARSAQWDEAVSTDPSDPRFSFSVGGHGMFVVGMHPASSRLARRFPYPALVFNPRAQFDHLRETGHFDRLRERVREREIALQGSINPNLADFGEQSDARQYSGRAVEPDWTCPFHHRIP